MVLLGLELDCGVVFSELHQIFGALGRQQGLTLVRFGAELEASSGVGVKAALVQVGDIDGWGGGVELLARDPGDVRGVVGASGLRLDDIPAAGLGALCGMRAHWWACG